MGTLLFTSFSRTTMKTIILAFLLLAFQRTPVQSMPAEECCRSKTVGSYSYTLADSPGNFPGICKKACAYTRDDDPNSLYCFAEGGLPVTCNDEDEFQTEPTEKYGPFGNLPGELVPFSDGESA